MGGGGEFDCENNCRSRMMTKRSIMNAVGGEGYWNIYETKKPKSTLLANHNG